MTPKIGLNLLFCCCFGCCFVCVCLGVCMLWFRQTNSLFVLLFEDFIFFDVFIVVCLVVV